MSTNDRLNELASMVGVAVEILAAGWSDLRTRVASAYFYYIAIRVTGEIKLKSHPLQKAYEEINDRFKSINVQAFPGEGTAMAALRSMSDDEVKKTARLIVRFSCDLDRELG
jgi:hypothetical protein